MMLKSTTLAMLASVADVSASLANMKQLMLNRLSKNGIDGTARFVFNHVLQTNGNLIGYGCWCAFDADANNIGEAFEALSKFYV